MELETLICQNCGHKAKPEAGRGVICPCCGNEMSPLSSDNAAAFAQDMQFAPPPVQPVPDDEQTHSQFLQKSVPLPELQIQPEQFASTGPQYTPEQLAQAKKKRRFWHILNIAMPVIQAIVLSVGTAMYVANKNQVLGLMLISAYRLSTPVCGILSGLLRPDDAYLEKKPLFKTRVAQGTMQFVLGTIASAIASGILATPLCRFFDSFV